jgi:DNA-directed RNA polymerase specialized sigma24 family protein
MPHRPSTTAGREASRDEIISARLALSAEDEKRLLGYAVLQIRFWDINRKDLTEEDFLQEAFLRALSGKRRWYLGKELFVKFMFGVIRSLARDWRRATIGILSGKTTSIEELREAADHAEGALEAQAGGRLVTLDSPEELLHVKQRLEALQRELEDEPNAWCLLEYMYCDGLSAEEAQAKLGIGSTEFDALRKKIERRFRKIFFPH